MQALVDMTQSTGLTVGATGVAAILQCVRVILSTIKGTVPLDRDFGISAAYLDTPLPEAMAAFIGEIVDAVEAQEPRVDVSSVTFKAKADEAMEGRLYPVVQVSIKEDALDG